MKKIIFLFTLVFALCSLNAMGKDFSEGQKKIRLELVKYLSSEGLKPSLDTDGDIRFEKDDQEYVVEIIGNWENPYIVSLYLGFNYSDDYTREKLENCISLVATLKAVKLFCQNSGYTYRFDMPCYNISNFKSTFHHNLELIEAARDKVSKAIKSGTADIDLSGDKDELFKKALLDWFVDETDKSFPIFKALADDGYAKAYGYMGRAYELGEGTNEDADLMESYYNKAIDNGYVFWALRLANYYYGKGQYTKALEYYDKCGANENGNRSDALYMAGKMYLDGKGVPVNVEKAKTYFRKSALTAESVKCDARDALADMGETAEDKNEFVDASKADLLGLSVKEMYDKGYEYEHATNHRQLSLPKAYAYYKAAADRGYMKAYAKMGEIYASKYYPFHDTSKSNKYYQKVFKFYKPLVDTDGEACGQLANMYEHGLGVDVDKEQARYYYKLGAMKGDAFSSYGYGMMCKESLDYPEAAEYFKKGSDGGNLDATLELAKLYEEGKGVSTDRDKAKELYQKVKDDAEIFTDAYEEAKRGLSRLEK